MKLNLTVTLTDGTIHEVSAGVPEIVMWEQKTKGKISDWQGGVSLSDLTFLAWASLSRKKVTDLKYDLWIDSVDDIAADDADPKSTTSEA